MNKIWLVARSTYRRRVRSGSFLLLTLGLPLIMIIAGAVPFIRNSGALPPVGYVDQTGQLAAVSQVPVGDQTLDLTAYATTTAAEDALQQGEIAGYLVIPEGYSEGAVTTFYGEEQPSESLEEGLSTFMQRALLPDASPAQLERLSDPVEGTFVASESGEEVSEGLGLIIQIATPAALAIVFALAVFTGANQMGVIVVREKDQRAMEMIVTSMAPWQLVAGKILGMTLLSLTQVAIWTLGALAAIVLALSNTADPVTVRVPWLPILWALLLGIPGYFLFATLGSGIGVIAGESQQARQLSGYLGMLGLFPLYFTAMIIDAPNGPLAIGLTLFPLTAPMMSLLRMAMTTVPVWQLLVSLGILLASLVAAVWAVARIFRVAMLMYGQSLNPKQLLNALRAS
ncbi:MAG: ABC transporter permease [Anaerolineae bacterium]|jgi:ABC-2 type transport system permease protein